MKHTALALAVLGVAFTGVALGSSHREAPAITKTPKVDGTDFYMFRSYESGREGYVTFIANYQPFESAYGGPNYFLLDPSAAYQINIDNNGDARSDLTLQFRFRNDYQNIKIPVNGVNVAVPLSNVGPIGTDAQAGNRNVRESYTVTAFRAGSPFPRPAKNLTTGGYTFLKPFDNIGNKSIADYRTYSDHYVTRIAIPGCAGEGRVFVGQRNEGFSVNVGEIFDLINTNPVGPPNGERNILADDNVTSIAVELPIACVTGTSPIIGAWTAAYLPTFGIQRQVSRLSAPLINEVIIGLPDKDRFNASQPRDDAQFATYVTNPTLPELIQALFPGVSAPNLFPRADLVAAFLTGVPGLNQPSGVRPAEMMRLNTSIAPKTAVNQQTLGVLSGDTAGFPNGRRPGDDVVDIELRVAMGALLTDAQAPSRNLPYTDGAEVLATDFRNTFPYLNTPIPGSPNPAP